MVRFIAGVIYLDPDSQETIEAVSHFKKWRKKWGQKVLVLTVPKELEAEIKTAVQSVLEAAKSAKPPA